MSLFCYRFWAYSSQLLMRLGLIQWGGGLFEGRNLIEDLWSPSFPINVRQKIFLNQNLIRWILRCIFGYKEKSGKPV